MRLLIIEDNSTIAGSLRQGLIEHNCDATVCTRGIEGERMAATGAFDVIVLDVDLPDRSGLKICQSLRQLGVTTPVLMLTVMAGAADKVRGLESGADDYLVKPFDFDELLARIHALQRRSQAASTTILKHGDLELDYSTRTVKRDGEKVTLTRREFDLLAYFLRNPHRILTREAIGMAVWDHNFDPQSNVIDVYVCTLRRKISDRSKPVIRTVIGSGYILDGSPSTEFEDDR